MHPLEVGKRYCLRLPGGHALGHVFIKQLEDGWAEGPFTPTAEFEPYRGLFERESRFRRDQVIPLWEETADEIEGLDIEVLEDPVTRPHLTRPLRGLRVFVEGDEAMIGARQETT